MIGIDDAVTAVSGVIGKVIDRIWPDPTINAQMKADLAKQVEDDSLKEYLAQTDLLKGQIDVNKTEAASPNWWVAGGRPCIIWVGAFGFGVQFVFVPLVGYVYSLFGHTAPPPIQLDPMLMDVLAGILGLNIGARTYEKTKGVVGQH